MYNEYGVIVGDGGWLVHRNTLYRELVWNMGDTMHNIHRNLAKTEALQLVQMSRTVDGQHPSIAR